MTQSERTELRRAIIAGLTDCAMTPPETAAFIGISESSLRALDIPRADVAGTKYLKSQVLLYVKNRLSHQLVA